MIGEAWKEVCSVSAELPAFCFEFQVLGNVRPVEGGLPSGDVRGSRPGRSETRRAMEQEC